MWKEFHCPLVLFCTYCIRLIHEQDKKITRVGISEASKASCISNRHTHRKNVFLFTKLADLGDMALTMTSMDAAHTHSHTHTLNGMCIGAKHTTKFRAKHDFTQTSSSIKFAEECCSNCIYCIYIFQGYIIIIISLHS